MSTTELRMTVDQLAAFVKEPRVEDRTVTIGLPARLELVDRAIEAQVAVMLSYRVVHLQARGLVPNYEASMCKMYATELAQRITRTGVRLMGPFGIVHGDSRWAALGGRFARMYLMSVASTIAGGTSEVQRMIIAQRGIGLPRGD